MHYISYKQRRFLRWLLLSLLSLVLAACSTNQAPQLDTDSATEFAYVAKADIDADASQAEIEAMYGGSTILFKPNAGFAILGFSEDEAALTTLAVDPNIGAFRSPELSAAGVDAWAGGVDAWAGGWDAWAGGWDAWAGGWDAWAGGHGAWSGGHGAWSGGESQQGPASNQVAFDQIKLAEAHALSRNYGNGVTVAVLDTGIDLDHSMFSGRLSPDSTWKDYIGRGNDTYPQEAPNGSARGHGTAVSGVVLQVAPKAKILPIRVLNQGGVGDTDDIILAIEHAVAMGADIINLSAGSIVHVAAMQAMVDYANTMGVYVVASSGNNGLNGPTTYPAKSAVDGADAKLLSVGSVNANDVPSSFGSFYSPGLHYFAPGENIRSAYPGNQTATATGTSFAAPLVTGSLALAKAEVSASYHDRLNMHLSMSTDSVGYADGRLNVEQLIRSLPGFTEPTYQIVNARSGKCLGVDGSRGHAYQYSCSDAEAQQFGLRAENSAYKIVSQLSAKVLEIKGNWFSDRGTIGQWGNTNSDDQFWYFQGDASGYYTIVSKASSKCLNIALDAYSEGAALEQYSCGSTNSQQFEVRRLN